MSNTKKETSAGGIGFVGFLALLFIGLKLTGHIGWSWWWVLSPLWIPWVVLLLGAACVFLCWLGIAAIRAARRPRRPARKL